MSLGGKTLLVSAAAGSGKTSVLTERIIRTLTDQEHPCDLSRILVVTFTRAAAAELKGRIAEALTAALSEDPGNSRLAKQLLSLGSADISTIDAFFQKTVRANFEKLGLPATFKIADNQTLLSLKSDIAEGLIEEFYELYADGHSSETLNGMRHNAFAEALDHLLSNRSDGKLVQNLLRFYERFASYPQGIGLLHSYAEQMKSESNTDFLKTTCGAVFYERLMARFICFEKELTNLEARISVDPECAAKCHALLSSDISFCRALLDALQKKSYTRVQTVFNSFVAGRFPTIRNKPVFVTDYQEFRAIFRKEIARVTEQLQAPPELLAKQMLKTAELSEILYRYFSAYEERLLAEKKSRGTLEHNDIRAFLYKLLTNADGSPSEFADLIASQYDAVYIDEYQDVDAVQDRIFALIGRDRRFMVGDIKQSIYGFRGSDPSVFAGYRRRMPLYQEPEAESADGVCVFMSDNFRCNEPVIRFTNRVCSFLFSACEGSIGYRPHDDLVFGKQCERTDQPLVQIAVFDRPSAADETDGDEQVSRDEAVWVAAQISQLLRTGIKDNGEHITPSDIAILVRNRAHGASFVKELEALSIPVAAEAATDLLHEPILTDVLNLLRAIDNPYRDIPLTEYLLSPIGGFSLQELSDIRAHAPHHKALYDALCVCAEANDGELSEKCKIQALSFQSRAKEAVALPADRFLRLLYLDEALIEYANEPSLLYLYDQARIYQRNAFCGLYGFLKHIEKLTEGNAAVQNGFAKPENAVSIMTVHHSKGLEYPVVFLASCGSNFNRSDLKESLLFHPSVGCASKLYDPTLAATNTTLLREAVAIRIDEEQAEENIRTLYVALTRARERLYVTGTLYGKWETALSNASMIKKGDRISILACNSYLAQILASIKTDLEDPFMLLSHITHDEIEYGEIYQETKVINTAQEPTSKPKNELAVRYAEVLERRKSAVYENSMLNGLPTKIAASKISHDLLDHLNDPENEYEATARRIELMRASAPAFSALLSDKAQATAAEIGTATHSFLEFCNYEALLQNGVDAECERMIREGFLDDRTVEILDREQLSLFSSSNLSEMIKQAKEVRREQHFGIFVPYAELTLQADRAERLGEHRVFVQGSIDLILEMENGELYLFDYKSDHITSAEKKDLSILATRLQKAHQSQLACYAKAMEELFGKAPDKIFIYSIPLGQALEIPLS